MGTLFVDKLDPQSGTSLEIGSSGDTISVPSGATINLSNATQTGVGGTNTPNFLVAKSGNQTISSDTATKVSLGTELYDSDNVFGSDKFTVPSGQGGKYNLFGNVQLQSSGTNKIQNCTVYFYKNGSEATSQPTRISKLFDSNDVTRQMLPFSFAINLSASDYIEIYTAATHSTGGDIFVRQEGTYFGGYKIIE